MPDALDVPVAGGLLRVATWPGGGTPVLAIHGITSSSRSWPLLARELDRPVVAPDLRGRGRSNRLPGPVGLVAHAEDCAAALRAVTDEPAVVVGHSMGGFVATVLAAQHPAFARDWTPEVEEYADYDLPDDPGRPSADPDAVEADQLDMLESPAFADAVASPRHPRAFLHAPRGFADDPPGLYPQATVDAYDARWPDLDVRPVPDVNHYTIVLSHRGASAVAAAVEGL